MTKKLVIFIDWFIPAYKAGGPIKSVLNIVETLSDKFDIRIITSNKDVDGSVLSVYSDQWIKKDCYEIIFLSDNVSMFSFLREESIVSDNLYFNSVFSVKFTIIPLLMFKKLNVRKVLAPRGMLGEGALKIKSIKKKLFVFLAKKLLFNDIIWHASTDEEDNEIRQVIGKNEKIIIAQNISSLPTPRVISNDFKPVKALNMVFISRISKKKNLLFILDTLSKLNSLGNIVLDIYGPIEDKHYWEKCKILVDKDERFNYRGLLLPEEINSTLINYHFYILPTFHENYGHSIVEAINAGVPVLISRNTPWSGLINHNIGYDLPLNSESWINVIKELYNFEGERYKKMTQMCLEFSKEFIVNSTIIDQNKKLFK